MGADIYINGIDGDEKRWYFRDSYGDSNAMRCYGLSWWGLADMLEKMDMMGEDGEVSPMGVLLVYEKLKKAKMRLPPDADEEWIIKHCKELVEFFERAVKIGKGMRWSV